MAAKDCTKRETIRIVMLGKTGNGKSTIGNSLTGRKPQVVDLHGQRNEGPPTWSRDGSTGFKVGRGLSSTTKFCNWIRAERMGTVLEVTDTPGLCDTDMEEEDIYKELAKSVIVAKPGAHVILFVTRCDKPFTKEELEAYTTIKRLFSEEMSKYLILVFNGMDVYGDGTTTIEEQRELLKKDIEERGDPLKTMIRRAEGRVFGMSNGSHRHPTSPSEIDRQIQDLITMMKDLMARNGQHQFYRTEMTDQILQMAKELVDEKANEFQQVELEQVVIEEEVSPGFFDPFIGVLKSFARGTVNTVNAVKGLCSVM